LMHVPIWISFSHSLVYIKSLSVPAWSQCSEFPTLQTLEEFELLNKKKQKEKNTVMHRPCTLHKH
jgi:hypothetical protein